MKRFIVILLVLVLVGGGGAGGLIMMGIVPNPFNPEGGGFFSAADDAAASMEKKFQPPTAAFQLVKVSDMVVPVIVNGRLVRRVSVTVRLIVGEASNKTLVESNLPHYQDIMLQELIPYFQSHFYNNDVVDIKGVKKLLLEQSKKIYGDIVTDVLLINVFQQDVGR